MENLLSNEPFERLNPLNDYLFYKVMGEKGDEVQLLGFLNAVLGRSGKEHIESLEIMDNTSFIKTIKDGKSCILDVLAILQDGTKVNIEVQLKNQHDMDRRSIFYCDRVQSESLKEGQDYRELPNMIAINIVDFDFPPGGKYHTSFRMREDADPSLVLSEALEIHFVNMVQWRKLEGKDVNNDPLHRWMVRLDEYSPRELVEEVAKMDMAIMAANEKLEIVMQDEEARHLYWRCEMAKKDERGRLRYARDEGLAEGLTQGIEQGRAEGLRQGYEKTLEIARKMKARGRPLEEIAEVTGLAPETVETL